LGRGFFTLSGFCAREFRNGCGKISEGKKYGEDVANTNNEGKTARLKDAAGKKDFGRNGFEVWGWEWIFGV
jgi:hypothetical protein